MSDDGRDRFEIPKDMRSMAAASFEHGRKGFEKFLSGALQTAGSIEQRSALVRAGAKDIGTKAMSYAENNVQASLDYAQSLLHEGSDRDHAPAQRMRAGPDALAARAGKRNGPNRQPRGNGRRQAEKMIYFNYFLNGRAAAPHPVRVCHAALHPRLHCIAQNCHVMGAISLLPNVGHPP